jgi:hypothetical protein
VLQVCCAPRPARSVECCCCSHAMATSGGVPVGHCKVVPVAECDMMCSCCGSCKWASSIQPLKQCGIITTARAYQLPAVGPTAIRWANHQTTPTAKTSCQLQYVGWLGDWVTLCYLLICCDLTTHIYITPAFKQHSRCTPHNTT